MRRTVARRFALELLLVFGVAAAVAIVMTWPLVRELDTMVADAADGPFQAWTIDHVQWAAGGNGPLWNANIFAPNRHTLAYSDNLIGLAVPLLPLRWVGLSPVAQLNVALLVGVASSAAAGYLFGFVVSRRRAVAAVAAAAFAFGPFGTASLTHVHAAFHGGIGVAAAAAWWLADRAKGGRPLRAPAAVLAVAVIWQTSVSFYPGAYAGMAAVLVIALRWRDLGRAGRVAAGGALVASAAGALVLALPYLAVLREGRGFVRSASEVANLGIDLAKVDDRLTLWGDLLGGGEPIGLRAFPGAALVGLGAAGLLLGLRAGGVTRRTAVAGAAFVVLGLFLALGTSNRGWRAWSPYRVLFEYVPGFTVIRATGRAWVLGVLGLGLLAGIACAVGRRTALLATITVVAIVAEGHSSWEDRPTIQVSAADRALASLPEEGGVLYLPMFVPGPLAVATTFGQVANVYGTTAHHRVTPNGYSGLAPEEWPKVSERMREVPSPSTLRELRQTGVRFVVVRRSVESTPWEPLLEPTNAEPLRLVGRYEGDLLYELP